MELEIGSLTTPPVPECPVEIVERKGLGHPDTICDAVAEALSLALSRVYLERCGRILHHNVDKVLLRGGSARPAFGGGDVLEPIEIYLAGRAAEAGFDLDALARTTTSRWLREHMRALDPERHVRIECLVRPGSADLVDLFEGGNGRPLANDTSMGCAYAPLSELEGLVLSVEELLTAPATRAARPALGEDVKVMGVRRGDAIDLTVACALIGGRLRDVGAYSHQKAEIARLVQKRANALVGAEVEVCVNAADDEAAGRVYLTVTGLSAEAGDDGEAGRGNRVNGLIAPERPTTLESVAGKNPVTHVGKLYNVTASLLARDLVRGIPEIEDAEVRLVSRIGRPVDEPQVVDVRLRVEGNLAKVQDHAARLARAHVAAIPGLWRDLLAERIRLDRWPLRDEG
jgi:S-adenosylmethionine synthetase